MNNNPTYGPHDQASSPDADEYFLGVDERLAPPNLPPGMASGAANMRFRSGEASTRLGVQICPWMKGDGRTPWTEVYGAAIFSDPNARAEWFLIAADGQVWKTRPNQSATVVPLPSGVILSNDSFGQFVQCFNVLILLRGPDDAPLVCDNLDTGFRNIMQTAEGLGAGLSTIPDSGYGVNVSNRLLLIQGKDELAVSELQDYTSYLALQNSFRINAGSVDALVAIAPFDSGDPTAQTLILFKDTSIYRLTVPGADFSQSDLLPVTDKYGCAAPRSVTKSGRNMYWFAETGIAGLTLTVQNQLQDTDTQLSDPMLKTFARINPLYVAGIVCAIWNQRLYAALPLDEARSVGPGLIAAGASYPGIPIGDGYFRVTNLVPGHRYHFIPETNPLVQDARMVNGANTYTVETDFIASTPVAVFQRFTQPTMPAGIAIFAQVQPVQVGINNAVAVYDFVNQQWCGVDESPGIFAVKQFLKTKYNGRKRLFIIGQDGVLRLYEEGFEDEVFTADVEYPVTTPIETTFIPRGYRCQDQDQKRFLALCFQLRTWNPLLDLSAIVPGVNAEQPCQTGLTRSNVSYDVQGQDDWDPTNVNDDHGTPKRLDYHVEIPGAIEDDTDGEFFFGSGVNLDAEQASTERVPVDEHGAWMQAKLVCRSGRVVITGALMESQPARRDSGAHVN